MSGAYTIDPNGTGSRNFTTFGEVTKQLFLSGVSGAVTFTVASGTYKESFGIYPIAGASLSNKVTFKSAVPLGAKLQPTNRETVTLVAASSALPVQGVVLDGFDFIPGAASNDSFPLRGGANCNYIEIKNCRFQAPPDAGGLLYASGSGGSTSGWKIHHNEFRVMDMYRGLYVIFPMNFEIYQNTVVLKECYAGLTIIGSTNGSIRVYNNLFSGKVDDRDPTHGAIEMTFSTLGVEIVHNTVLIDSIMGAGIVMVRGDRTKPPLISNNILVNTGGGPAFRTRESETSYWVSDGNLFWTPGNTNNLVDGPLGSYASLSAWQGVGQDKNSVAADPLFVSTTKQPFDLRIKRESPAKDKAYATPGYVQLDFAGRPRDIKPDIGAYEVQPLVPYQVFGQGCAGNGGKVPTIGMSGNLKIGSNDFFVTLGNATGGNGVSAFFALGVTKTTLNFGGGCTLLVTPSLLLQLPVSGFPGPGNGSSSLKLPIPNNPKLMGAKAHVQWGVVDPAAVGIGIAFSSGATLSL